MTEIGSFFQQQLSQWEQARNNYDALSKVRMKEFHLGSTSYKVQFNPARIVSSAAKVDSASLKARKCFLCAENRPAAQIGIPFGSHYTVLVNPFPIFPRHLTIPELIHTPQRIGSRMKDMLDLADFLRDFTLFYNGPRCGASAPDHLHFQAGIKGFLPIEKEWQKERSEVARVEGAVLWHINLSPCPVLAIEATDKVAADKLFGVFYDSMGLKEGEEEPMMNILVWKEKERWIIVLFPRTKHRPDCYFASGEANLLISPASVDMGGVFITPLEKDFEKIQAEDIRQILEEVCYSADDLDRLEKQMMKRL
jgi:ATP adenylyltransferase/5',5'''-P-1,P-4-tetraphosphate phosphorylase II